jgi:hypothetical protein
MKLTDKQRQHLLVLQAGETGAYGGGLHMGVLNSLALKGLVATARGVGSFYSPRTAIKWRITDAGRAALVDTELTP